MSLTKLSRGDVKLCVDSNGAQLTSLIYAGKEYLWQKDSHYWTGQAPVLFPIVGNLRNDQATSSAGTISLKRHGLARLYEHTLIDSGRDHVQFEFCSTDETRSLFPYDFCLRVSYSLADDEIEQRFAISNTGECDLPFFVGGHPAFNVPLDPANENFDDYILRFSRKWSAATPVLTADGLWDYSAPLTLLNNERNLAITHELFANDAILFENIPQSTVALVSQTSGHGVAVDFSGFDYLGVWSAQGSAPFVCLEPWTGTSTTCDEGDVFEEKRGCTILKPLKTREFSFTIKPF